MYIQFDKRVQYNTSVRNASNYEFLISISLQPSVVDLRYFKLRMQIKLKKLKDHKLTFNVLVFKFVL